jgi:hypothetical protein
VADENTPFNYLLNAMERAGQDAHPAKRGYAGKRKALMAHVRELELKAAMADELEQLWNILVQRAKEAVLTMPGESEFDLIQRAMLPRRTAGVKGPDHD